MSTRKEIDGLAIITVTSICLIWGLQQVFVKAVAADMPPVLQIALRAGIAMLLLATVMRYRKEPLISPHTWRPGLAAGVLFALEFFLVGEGLRYTNASHMVVFLYSTPIFVALGLHFTVVAERLTPLQWLGILLAFSGIALVFLWRDTGSSPAALEMLWGDLLAILAAVSWAATTVLVRSTTLANAPATQTLFYQLAACFVLVLITAIISNQATFTLTTAVAANLLFQGIVVSFASLLLWFWLLRQYPASTLGVFTFMTPIFGTLFGILILDEALDQSFIFGAIMVMGGILTVNRHTQIRRILLRKTPAESGENCMH